MGHPSRQTLICVMRLAKASDVHIRYTQLWNCPICLRRQPPASYRPASGHTKPTRFNDTMAIDLNIVEVATRFSMFARLDRKCPVTVVDKITEAWTRWACVPARCIHDQGREFKAEFETMVEKFGATCVVTSTEAPWENGLCEQHGAVLGGIVEATVEQCSLA